MIGVARRAGAVLVLVATLLLAPAASAADVRDDWALPKGFNLAVDSTGYSLPTAIAFVPHPGPGPKSPRYFVSELRGTIKVVTNDHSVVTFANLDLPNPPESYPALGAQNGSAGMCLDPKHGYVFVTYAAFDPKGVLRNGVARLSSTPGTFSLHASGRTEVGRQFAPYPTAANHQIGGCAVLGDSVFVGVGDGTISSRAQDVDKLSGKIVRMTLDGKPYPGNPFFSAPPSKPRRYVWAYGFRNPFGLALVGDQLFATQNGISIDSFLRIERGRNYGWDGNDDSIETNAEAVMNPAVAPVHLAFYPGGKLFPKEYAGTFFFGSAESAGDRNAGVLQLAYDVKTDRVVHAPSSFVRFRRPSGGEVAGVALGPDGLYFAPIVPSDTGATNVYKVTYDPAARYPHQIELNLSGSDLFQRFGCRSCHTLDNVGGDAGPKLDEPGLEQDIAARLSSPAYKQRVEKLDRLNAQPFASYRDARKRVLATKGDEQVALWIKYRLLQPKFDDPNATMPQLGLTDPEAARVADYLLHGEAEFGVAAPSETTWHKIKDGLKSKKFLGGVFVGFVGACFVVAVLWLLRRRRAATA